MSSEIAEAVAAMIAEAQTARETAYAARQEQRRTARDQHRQARNWGLQRRHARKLARNRGQASIA